MIRQYTLDYLSNKSNKIKTKYSLTTVSKKAMDTDQLNTYLLNHTKKRPLHPLSFRRFYSQNIR